MSYQTEDWQPSCHRAALVARSRLYQAIRRFFQQRDALEVETPMLSQAAVCDPNIEPMQSHGRWLQTSPEYPMKRLLCAGSGDIWQLCKVFRKGEAGQRHNPEFTMLEWYRLGWDEQRLILEVAELVQTLFADKWPNLPVEALSYEAVFQRYTGMNLYSEHSHSINEQAIREYGIDLAGQDLDLNTDGWLDIIMSHKIEPELPKDTLVFVYDFPASQAALAKVSTNERGVNVAKRFELFFNGTELANGYHELTDAAEQKRRFMQEAAEGRPIDERLLNALASGMPESAGVAMGVDRLLMHLLDAESISQVLSFDWPRA